MAEAPKKGPTVNTTDPTTRMASVSSYGIEIKCPFGLAARYKRADRFCCNTLEKFVA